MPFNKLLLVLLLGGAAWSQTLVNACGNFANGSGSGTNKVSVTLASTGGTSGCTTNVSANDLLIVGCGADSGATINTPTDTLGNTWTQDESINGTGGAGNAKVYHAISASSGSDTVSCNVSTTGHDPHVDVREVSGITVSTPFDAGNTTQSTSSSPSVSATTTNASDYVYGFIHDSPNSRALTVGSGFADFVLTNNTVGGDATAGEDKNVTSSGSQSASFGGTGGDATVLIIAAYKAASSSPTPTCTMALMGAGPC